MFWAFVLLYAMLILYRPAFNIIDDHKFLDTVRVSRFVPPFIEPDRARFSPLLAQEYNLVSLVSYSAAAFYAFNVVELFGVAWLLVRIGQAIPAKTHPAVSYVATALILLSPGFTVSWFRLWVQEKDELLLLAAFVATYLSFRARGNRRTAMASLLCATLSLYTKESAFVPIAAVGISGLIFDSCPENFDHRLLTAWRNLHLLLLATSAGFLAFYYGLVYRHRGTHLYGSQPGSRLMNHLHAMSASLLHEPLLIPGLFLLTCLVFLRPRADRPPPLRVLLLAALSLVAAYAALGLSNTYYLLPAYVFVPYFAAAVASAPDLRHIFQRPWIVAFFCLLLCNQCLAAVQQITIWRTGADNFQAMLPRLEERLKQPHRSNLFLDGVDVGSGSETFQGLASFLYASGLTPQEFDLLTNAPANTSSDYRIPIQTELSFTDAIAPQPSHAGDLLLVTPADPAGERQKFVNTADYQLLFKTTSFAYQNLTLKTLMRRAVGLPLGADVMIDPNYSLYIKLPRN